VLRAVSSSEHGQCVRTKIGSAGLAPSRPPAEKLRRATQARTRPRRATPSAQ